MCIRDRACTVHEQSAPDQDTTLFKVGELLTVLWEAHCTMQMQEVPDYLSRHVGSVSYTHLRAHETVLDLVCRLLLEKKKHHRLTQRLLRSHTQIST